MASGTARRVTQKRSRQTMERYMDAAEALFIKYGYEGASIRAISTRAKKNLSTVVYHWGTKEELFRAVLVRRFEAIEARKIATLKALQGRPSPIGPDDLEDVLAAMVDPGFAESDDDKAAYLTRQLYGRVLTDPSPVVLQITEEMFREVTDLWRSMVRQCLPGIQDDTFFWRFTSIVGTLIFAQSFGYRVAHANRIEDGDVVWDSAAREIVRFMAAGLRAPS